MRCLLLLAGCCGLCCAASLENLAHGFDGRVGACIESRTGSDCLKPDEPFALQSVMKLVVAAAAMDRVDHQQWSLDERIVVHREDLSLFVEPIAKLVTDRGFETTLGDLVRRAVVDSDSAAADILIAKLGGTVGVRAFLQRKGIAGVRVDRDEKHLQTEILGMAWRAEFVDPAALDRAIAAVPDARRTAAYRRYQADVRDTATPRGMSSFLFTLAEGRLLSPASTARLMKVMTETVTFPDRLKAGVPAGWTFGHKTGTSGSWKGVTAATNDVGILAAPDGGHVAVVVFIGDCREPEPKRAALMANVARLAVASYR